jgi:hypothetical protein
MADHHYVGTGKVVGRFGNISIGIRYADLNPNDRGYVNLIVAERKSPDQWGKTHTVYVDDWTPNAGRDQRGEERHEQSRQNFQPNDPLPPMGEPPASAIDDLPF